MTTLTVLAAILVVLIGVGWIMAYLFYQPGNPSAISIGTFSIALIFLIARFTDWINSK